MGALFRALLLDQFTARQHDVLPLLIDFDDLELVTIADELREVPRRNDINLRRRQKRLDADVDDQAALDDGLHLAGDAPALFANRENLVPILLELRLLVREDDRALLVFKLLDEHINLVADLDGVGVNKFIRGDDAFAFVTDVHQNFLGADFDDLAFDNFALGKTRRALLHGLFHCEHNLTVLNCGNLGTQTAGNRSSIA